MTKLFFGLYDTDDKENMNNPTPTQQATIGELFKVLMGSIYAQMLHQYQNNYIQLLYSADLFNVGLTIVYSPIQWLTKTKVHYPVPIMSVPSYIPLRFIEDRDFNHWLRNFERYASQLKDKTGALLTLIEESCLIKLEQRLLQQKPNASYEEIIEVLTNFYRKNAQYHDPLREFVSRRQRPNVMVYNYLSELESLARAAHPDQRQALLEPMILDRFIRGIHDVKIKQELCKSSPIGSIDIHVFSCYQRSGGGLPTRNRPAPTIPIFQKTNRRIKKCPVNCVIKRSETGDTDLSVVVISKYDDSDDANKHVNVISNKIECEATDPTQRVVVTAEEQDRDEDILWAKNLVRIHGDEQPTLKKIELDSHFKRAVYQNYEHLRLVDETLFL
ncbi:hypothetical protein BpHYR1_002991 [Brachionus plicatilis]|uniref:Retrotransposon gag domain-containing protein n=1 Tax=Brachionus plicatilis TaxID=10195 RepID=A0A3M7RFZ6_BRAPC|nr:hypothetical protein BpHYR1_002991 [Brachionus plicatilis]